MADRVVRAGNTPALGDVRALGAGDVLWLDTGLRTWAEWHRFTDAVRHAVARGAEVRWVGDA
jgi:hypothetical protein